MPKRVLLTCCLLLTSLAGPGALADTIAVIGTGNVGMALGTQFAEQGHTIIYGSRTPDADKAQALVAKTVGDATAMHPAEAAARADIVILAVPGMVSETVAQGLGDLGGKIVMDATNPLIMMENRQFDYGVATSNGEIVQSALPGAHVVKAFNTIPWALMIDPELAGQTPLIPLSSDHPDAKARVADLVRSIDLVPLDFGPLKYSRWTEMTATIMLNQQFAGRDDFVLLIKTPD